MGDLTRLGDRGAEFSDALVEQTVDVDALPSARYHCATRIAASERHPSLFGAIVQDRVPVGVAPRTI